MEPDNTSETGRNKDGTFKPGFSGNPGGRAKNPLKDYVRQKFAKMTEEEKEAFLKTISPDIQWKMAEGNPHQTEEHSGEIRVGKPIDDVQENNSVQKDQTIN